MRSDYYMVCESYVHPPLQQGYFSERPTSTLQPYASTPARVRPPRTYHSPAHRAPALPAITSYKETVTSRLRCELTLGAPNKQTCGATVISQGTSVTKTKIKNKRPNEPQASNHLVSAPTAVSFQTHLSVASRRSTGLTQRKDIRTRETIHT